ncbi:hypothetical protein CsSME_00048163 [Camellia sinensis var. sinensis]
MIWCQDQRIVLSILGEMDSFVGGRSSEPLKGEIFELNVIVDSSESSGQEGISQRASEIKLAIKQQPEGFHFARGHSTEILEFNEDISLRALCLPEGIV